jgi:hypothetical protein
MKVRNSQVDSLFQAIESLTPRTDTVLVYFVAMNLPVLRRNVEALRAVRKPSPDYLEYEQRRNRLCVEYADRDAQSRPISEQVALPGGGTVTVYSMDERKEEFDAACALLDTEFQDVCQQRMTQEVEVHALMQQEVDVDLVSIRMSECPAGVITGGMATVLMETGLLVWDVEKPGEQTEI